MHDLALIFREESVSEVRFVVILTLKKLEMILKTIESKCCLPMKDPVVSYVSEMNTEGSIEYMYMYTYHTKS